MTILVGILLYVLCIAWLCALTGANRLDGPERAPKPRRIDEPSEAAREARPVSATEVHI